MGYSVENALRETVKDLRTIYKKEVLLIKELTYVIRQIEMNLPVETALTELANRTEDEDVQTFVTVFNMAKRSGGDIYLGIVGAVRTGKSTFIKKLVETLIVPNIENEYERKRALDEIPQSAAGKTIMTTEPKFVPNNSAKIKIDDFNCNIRLIDCIGYMINNALGANDENGPRMVKTPWYMKKYLLLKLQK